MASVAIDDRGTPPDEAASRLFQEHSEWLLAFCTRQLRDRSDAEDAVQATFLYAFRALRRGVVPECERAWLTTIAKNVCHTHRRTAQRHPESPADPDVERIALAQPDLAEAGFMDDVRAALTSLPENQRRALVMREWQGASSSEIAGELHLSEPATDALLFRARKSFASAMSVSGKPFGALNVALLLEQLRGWAKPLLGGAAAKAAVATTAATVVVGGVVVEQRSGGGAAPQPRTDPAAATVDGKQRAAVTPAPSPVVTPQPADGRRSGAGAAPAAASAATAPAPETVTRLVRPTKQAPEPPALAAPPPPPTAETPSAQPPTPTPLPPVAPPAPPPIEVPPILGEETPIVLPQPLDDLLPPVTIPPLLVPPLPPPLPPLDEGVTLIP